MGERWDFEAAAARTVEAMRAGADVICQATFVDGSWRGRADFLLKTPGTRLGPWGYEALDAKLARAEKPTYVLQLCFYSDGIAGVQGATPRAHACASRHRRATHAPLRRLRGVLPPRAGAIRGGDRRAAATEAYPVEHCGLCSFRGVCRFALGGRRPPCAGRELRREQVMRLRDAGLPTLTALARAAPGTACREMAPHSFEALRDQAALQLERRTSGRLDWHPIECDAGRGFELLPQPSTGDVIFDIEGDPFWEPAQGLHFLFGLLLREGTDWRYRPIWAHDRNGRARDVRAVRRPCARAAAADPGMHVYHYGTYENAALKQLMGSYATREDAVDELLRRNVFINLHTVVRQGLRAGVEATR